jgi:CubicO group peptidase (beta-lactamase class C family)
MRVAGQRNVNAVRLTATGRSAGIEAFTGAVLKNGKKTNYGFAWRMSEYRHSRRIEHGGAWVGFRSHIARYPAIGLTVVLLSNRSDFEPPKYIDAITDIYMEAMDGRPPLKP